MRPTLHYTPRRGWMNDPNGLIHHGGVHHLFYQTNPASTEFGQIHWGHAISPDLLTWTEQPIALSPDQDYDSHGCWSGITVNDDGRIAILYSGNDGSALQLPCLAWAADSTLNHWTKDPDNPVITAPPPLPDRVTNFRDHTVTRQADGTWRQLIGGSTSLGGAIFAYTSTDLHHWTYTGLFADHTTLPISSPIWECPDSFAVDDSTVLILSGLDVSGTLTQPTDVTWALGHDNGDTLTAERTGLLDFGDRFYAPQSYWAQDGRRLMFGWIRTQADTVPSGQPWVGAMSLPRELSIHEGTVAVRPARELHAARGASTTAPCAAGSTTTETTPPHHSTFEIEISAELVTSALTIVLHDDDGKEHNLRLAPLVSEHTPRDRLTVYFDSGIVEAFHNGRAATWTTGPIREVSRVTIRHDSADHPRNVTLRAMGPQERLRITEQQVFDQSDTSVVVDD